MAFSCRWAHPLKWARNQGLSSGKHDHSQALNPPAQAELQSATKGAFSELHRTWIWPWISHWIQSTRVEPRSPVSLFDKASLSIFICVFCCQAEVLSWIAEDRLPPALTSGVLCLHSLGALLPLTGVAVACPCVQQGLSGMQGNRWAQRWPDRPVQQH